MKYGKSEKFTNSEKRLTSTLKNTYCVVAGGLGRFLFVIDNLDAQRPWI